MPEPVPLSQLGLDVPEPPAGWMFELERRGIPIVLDDIGRESITRDAARGILAEHREQEEAAARRRVEIERRAIEADQARRAAMPPGIPAGMVPEGMTAAQLMMASDPFPSRRRQSVLEHSLENPAGALVFHPIGGDE